MGGVSRGPCDLDAHVVARRGRLARAPRFAHPPCGCRTLKVAQSVGQAAPIVCRFTGHAALIVAGALRVGDGHLGQQQHGQCCRGQDLALHARYRDTAR